MIGGGQLARMTHQAAMDYGIALHVLAPSSHDPAVTAGAAHSIGRPGVLEDLAAVAKFGDIVTVTNELVPLTHLRALGEAGVELRPNPEALRFSCDKLVARTAFDALGEFRVPVPACAPVSAVNDVAAFAGDHGWPVVLKGRSGDHDGRGVHMLDGLDDARRLLSAETADSEVRWLVEEHLDLAAEFVILLARNPSGHVAVYPAIGTTQVDGICRELSMPADLPENTIASATRLAVSVTNGIDATGICAVEFFWTAAGEVMLNGLTLRPHHAGHVTMDASETSQCHQHLRAVLDWPLGPTDQRNPAATVNVIAGPDSVDPLPRLPAALAIPGTHIHLYGKTPRPGRRLGHVTALGASVSEALITARAAVDLLSPEG